MTCCTGDCRQGRDCANTVNASRAALKLPPLHRDAGNVYPELIEDRPPYTAESVSSSVWFLALVALMCTLATGFAGFLAMYLPVIYLSNPFWR